MKFSRANLTPVWLGIGLLLSACSAASTYAMPIAAVSHQKAEPSGDELKALNKCFQELISNKMQRELLIKPSPTPQVNKIMKSFELGVESGKIKQFNRTVPDPFYDGSGTSFILLVDDPDEPEISFAITSTIPSPGSCKITAIGFSIR